MISTAAIRDLNLKWLASAKAARELKPSTSSLPSGATEDHAVKELIAAQIAAAMQEKGLTEVEMAARMKPAAASSTGCLIRRFPPSRSTRFAAPRTRSGGRFASTWCDA